LKAILVDGYGLVSAQLLEEGPLDAAYQELLREELKEYEPRRVCRRLFGLSHAAIAGRSSVAW